MSSGPAQRRAGTTATAALRHIAGVAVSGMVGAVVWLVVMQEGPERNWSDHNYNQVVGQVFVGREDDVAKAGFVATLAIGVALAAVYALVIGPLIGRKGPRRAALVFAAVPLLLWGLVLAPRVTAYKDTALDEARQTIPGGVFGWDAGGITLLLAVVASLLFALSVDRIYRLMRAADWWRSRGDNDAMRQETLDQLVAPAPGPSLEFPEQRREEGREGPGR